MYFYFSLYKYRNLSSSVGYIFGTQDGLLQFIKIKTNKKLNSGKKFWKIWVQRRGILHNTRCRKLQLKGSVALRLKPTSVWVWLVQAFPGCTKAIITFKSAGLVWIVSSLSRLATFSGSLSVDNTIINKTCHCISVIATVDWPVEASPGDQDYYSRNRYREIIVIGIRRQLVPSGTALVALSRQHISISNVVMMDDVEIEVYDTCLLDKVP